MQLFRCHLRFRSIQTPRRHLPSRNRSNVFRLKQLVSFCGKEGVKSGASFPRLTLNLGGRSDLRERRDTRNPRSAPPGQLVSIIQRNRLFVWIYMGSGSSDKLIPRTFHRANLKHFALVSSSIYPLVGQKSRCCIIFICRLTGSDRHYT